jgi:hypothetical protein
LSLGLLDDRLSPQLVGERILERVVEKRLAAQPMPTAIDGRWQT